MPDGKKMLRPTGVSTVRKRAIKEGSTILTHYNAILATAITAQPLEYPCCPRIGKNIRVFSDETRPYLQGARLTAWELMRG